MIGEVSHARSVAKKKKSSSQKTRLTETTDQGNEAKKALKKTHIYIYMYMTKRHVLQIPFLPQTSKEVSLLHVLPETHKHTLLIPP